MLKLYMKKIIILSALFISLTVSHFYGQTQGTNPTAISNQTNGAYLQKEYEGEKTITDNTKNATPPSPVWTAIKVIIYIGVFATAAFFLIRYLVSRGALPATADEKIIEIILTKFIGMGSYIQIVKVGTSYYLISLSGEGARLLDKITDQETIDYLELNKENIKPRQSKFFDILTFFPKGRNIDKMDFLKNQKDRLRKL
jgi:flagellar biogenesis protein FliO